jgi:hypothetical protein
LGGLSAFDYGFPLYYMESTHYMYLNLGLGRMLNNPHGYNNNYRYGNWAGHGTISPYLPGPTVRSYGGYGLKPYDGATPTAPVNGGDG